MMLIDNEDAPMSVQSDGKLSLLQRLKNWLLIKRRRLPYLVWHGDQVDVTVTMKDQALHDDTLILGQIEGRLLMMGITFDTGSGLDEREWEWDWSLRGPISVSFRGVTKDPSKRTARPRPELVYASGDSA